MMTIRQRNGIAAMDGYTYKLQISVALRVFFCQLSSDFDAATHKTYQDIGVASTFMRLYLG